MTASAVFFFFYHSYSVILFIVFRRTSGASAAEISAQDAAPKRVKIATLAQFRASHSASQECLMNHFLILTSDWHKITVKLLRFNVGIEWNPYQAFKDLYLWFMLMLLVSCVLMLKWKKKKDLCLFKGLVAADYFARLVSPTFLFCSQQIQQEVQHAKAKNME